MIIFNKLLYNNCFWWNIWFVKKLIEKSRANNSEEAEIAVSAAVQDQINSKLLKIYN